MMSDINSLLAKLVEISGSHLHIKVGHPPVFRVHGRLVRTAGPPLGGADIGKLVGQIIDDDRKKRLMEAKELDLAYSVPGLARFRVNVFWQKGKIGAVMRVIPVDIKSIDDLGLPEVTKKFADLNRGLILVTGPTGRGKST